MTAKTKRALLLLGVILSTILLVGLLGLLIYLEVRPAEPAVTQPAATTAEPTPPPTTLPPPPPNEFDPNDFVYDEQGYLTYTAGTYERGIDVSSYQGKVNWKKVAASGVTFAIIRVGGRGYGVSTGNLYEDKMAQDNYKAAKKAGLKIGAYFFSQAITPEEAVEEAEFLLEKTADWELDMPLVYDWEYISETARTADVDQQTLTDCMIAFCERIKEADKTPMIYFNPNQAKRMFHIEQVTDYDFWLAMYTDWMTYPYKFHMWQYTNEGTVPGVSGKVDINLLFHHD